MELYYNEYSFRTLDISFNRVRKIENLEGLINLKKIFLCANKISRIENLNHLKNLEHLELGDNQIRVGKAPLGINSITIHVCELLCPYLSIWKLFVLFFLLQVIENLDGLTNLNSIFLGKNKITKLQNLDSLINLKILGVQVS